MYIRKKLKMTFICLAMSCVVTACTTKQEEPVSTVSESQAIDESIESTEDAEVIDEASIMESLNEELESYTSEDFENAMDKRNDCINGEEQAKLFLLDELDGIKFYTAKESSKLIVVDGDDKCIFDIDCVSMHGCIPEFLYKDIDGDGQKEIVIDAPLGTGTGVSVDFLYVLDRDAENKFVQKEFLSEDAIALMEEHFSYTYDEENEEVQYYVDGEPVGEPFSIYCEYSKSDADGNEFTEVNMQDFISYNLENDDIELEINLEGRIESWCGTPLFMNACMKANVCYSSDGEFSLSDVELQFLDNE